jgi:hypothetical protein
MDKRTFKDQFLYFLEKDVNELSPENKIKYMKKWIRDYELGLQRPTKAVNNLDSIKVGVLVQTTMKKIVSAQLLSDDRVRLLQDASYCKSTFDINYPLLKKVAWGPPLTEQMKINGYNRYWAEEEMINGERYLICSQWYDKNKPRFIKWVKEIKSVAR